MHKTVSKLESKYWPLSIQCLPEIYEHGHKPNLPGMLTPENQLSDEASFQVFRRWQHSFYPREYKLISTWSLNAGATQRLQIYWGFYILILIMHHKNCSHGSHIFHSLCPSHGSEWPHLWPSLSSSIRDLQQKAVRNTFHALPVVITWNLKDHSSSWKIWETSQQLQNQILFIFYKHAKFHSYKPEVSMDYANRLLRFLFCFSSIDMPQSWNSMWPNIHRLEARTLTNNKKIWNAMSSRSTTIHKHYLHY